MIPYRMAGHLSKLFSPIQPEAKGTRESQNNKCMLAHKTLLAKAIGKDTKGILSITIYIVAIIAAFIDRRLSLALDTLEAVMWLFPTTV